MKITLKQMVICLAAPAVLISAAVVSSGYSYRTMYSGIEREELDIITTSLNDNSIPHEIEQDDETGTYSLKIKINDETKTKLLISKLAK